MVRDPESVLATISLRMNCDQPRRYAPQSWSIASKQRRAGALCLHYVYEHRRHWVGAIKRVQEGVLDQR